MQIYVDADACPVVGIVEELAIKYKIPVTLLCDTNHVLYSDYSEVKIIGAGADAVDFAQAMAAFVEWIGQEPVRIYAWSESDKKQLLAELRYKKLYDGQLPPNMRRWMDFQKVYTRIMGLSRSMSLSSAINIIDNDFEGHQHSALDDAANSAELLRLGKNKGQFAQKTAGIKKVFNKKDEPLTSSIGDLLAAELARLQAEEDH